MDQHQHKTVRAPRYPVSAWILGALGLLGLSLEIAAQTLAGVTQIEVGELHSCALTERGSVKCWGYNVWGQLGDGTSGDRSAAVSVGSLERAVAIGVGGFHSCALTATGAVKCWGLNNSGMLGDGTSVFMRASPVAVVGLSSGVTAVAAGFLHTCALTTAGAVKCWGENGAGQIGDGSTIDRSSPVDVAGLGGNVIALAAGGAHTCALTATGTVKCWGNNQNGQLGDGSNTSRLLPVDVVGLGEPVQAIALGNAHTCAMSTPGGVRCWGNNDFSQLGDGSITHRSTPTNVVGLTSGGVSISTGSHHTCVVDTAGAMRCWGYNFNGQLGVGDTLSRTQPIEVSAVRGGRRGVSTGGQHTCAITDDRHVQCWGSNEYGQTGDGNRAESLVPTEVVGLAGNISAISAGESHTCAVTTTGAAHCWGKNGSGQIGDGSTLVRSVPTAVSGASIGTVAIDAGREHSCALTSSGGIRCWGGNRFGALGDGSQMTRLTPTDVRGQATGIAAISAGDGHTCAVTISGAAKCWGNNGNGQLGNNTTALQLTATDVTGLGADMAQISTNYFHTCALTSAGGVKCWGNGGNGRLGDGFAESRLTAVDVVGLTSGVTAIATGLAHSCALTSTGTVRCWGLNNDGALGDGTSTTRLTAVDVAGLTNIRTLVAGAYHTCALNNESRVKCWGFNNVGQLGDGSKTPRFAPTEVSGLGAEAIAITAGNLHTCAALRSGGAKCWGYNQFGQLGDGARNYALPGSLVVDGESVFGNGFE